MGEGVERDGRHIHVFVPEDTPNFNASHIIHELTFGPTDDIPMKDVTKIVAAEHGTSGLFQYFIKVVPTTYKGKDVIPASVKRDGKEAYLPALFVEEEEAELDENVVETNRYFYTERFRPLMTEYLEDDHIVDEGDNEDDDKAEKAAVEAGHSQSDSHSHKDHHNIQNSVLPGIFFIYEIYPFSVEVTREGVPFTHLLIRLLATVGGVFTVVSWAESALSGGKNGNNRRRQSPMNFR
uniref:Endoplasmic reticulum vesicle transporter C-terminal domain-containing protein n=1 Tax=Grammatophora oceanica TaxID=210454 RepID=A0A7S1UWY6_9STRA|mmetsp:Transcript_27722/g.40783  ORF Transcript_27722/g.40783 Transcript_27722/m.40783 type:complete len:237 (+) Transcript_27722:1-711(+)